MTRLTTAPYDNDGNTAALSQALLDKLATQPAASAPSPIPATSNSSAILLHENEEAEEKKSGSSPSGPSAFSVVKGISKAAVITGNAAAAYHALNTAFPSQPMANLAVSAMVGVTTAAALNLRPLIAQLQQLITDGIAQWNAWQNLNLPAQAHAHVSPTHRVFNALQSCYDAARDTVMNHKLAFSGGGVAIAGSWYRWQDIVDLYRKSDLHLVVLAAIRLSL